MELKLTTLRALEYERKTGKDLVAFMKEVSDTGTISIKDTVQLFAAMGENYTPALFDQWEGSYVEKIEAIVNAIRDYIDGGKGDR